MSDLTEQIHAEIEKQNSVIKGYRDALDSTTKTATELKESSAKFEEKIAELDKTIKGLETELAKAKAVNAIANAVESPEAKHFFNYMRTGVASPELNSLQGKQFKNSGEVVIGTPSQGGYAVPTEIASEITKLAGKIGMMRSLSRVISVNTPNYSELIDHGGAGSGWVGETSQRPQTDANTLSNTSPIMGEIYANMYASQYALDDMSFDVASWLVNAAVEAFALKEEEAFISGNGTNKPKGLFANVITNESDDTRAFGSLQYIPSGNADALPNAGVLDLFLDMIGSVKVAHLQNASFLMNRSIKTKLLKVKDAQARYIWQVSAHIGEPDTLFGYPVAISDFMPNEGTDAIVAAYGDFRKAFTIVDRLGVNILRDPYTNPPFTKFYVSKRVGTMLKDSEAVKVLKCCVS